MDIEYKGGNCVIITTKNATLAIDPNLGGLGLKDQGAKADVQLITQPLFEAPKKDGALIISQPGEYEVENISIKGVAVQAHIDAKTDLPRATMFRLSTTEVSLAVLGHIHPDLSDQQLESLGVIDVLIVPVGGNGYTLDATAAIQLIKTIAPKVVIPTHYADKDINYPVPQADLDIFLKDLGAPVEETAKLKLKSRILNDALVVQKLTRTT